MPEIGQTISHYQILDNLGHGGMGEVFLAKDRSLNRKVALKFLPRELQSDSIARMRFLREAQSAASLDHPNICTIYEVGEAEGEDFIVMEFVQGETLQDRLARGRPPLAEGLRIASEVADALGEAHEHDIVHRDLKPANIMLNQKGRAIVMDFGLAKQMGGTGDQGITETALTESGLAVGTLAYMSPEQLCGRPVDARSDIFSFGTVLFEILCGAHPFRKETAIATAGAILHQTPPALSLFVADVPGALQCSVERMLAKDRESRCQSIAEIRGQLKELLRQVESGAEQLKWWKPAWRPVILALSLVLVAAVLFWMAPRRGRSVSAVLGFHERDWVLVTDLENETGDPVFDKSLATALRISLEQSRYSNVFPQKRVGEALKRMRKTGVARIDAQLGQEIALREGIKALLVPALSGFGDRYRLTVAIRNPADSTDVRVVSADAHGKSDILGAVDTLAKSIRGDLGESMAAISQTARPLAKVTTPSLEALRLYSAGADKRNIETDFQEARLLFEKALEADPSFTSARGALGMMEYQVYDRGKGRRLLAEAARQADQLPESEKYMLLAFYAGVVLEDWEAATKHLRALLVLQPDNAATHHNLGLAYRNLGRYKEAIDELEQAARIDPHSVLTYNNLSITYLYHLGDPDAAIEVCRRQLAANPCYTKLGPSATPAIGPDMQRLPLG